MKTLLLFALFVLQAATIKAASFVIPSITNQPVNATTCVNGDAIFSVAATGTAPLTYQWQVFNGSIFVDLVNGGIYSNVTTPTLEISGVTVSLTGSIFHCVVSNIDGSVTSNDVTLTVNSINNWVGNISSDWFNPANWSCGRVPDRNEDIKIGGSGFIILPNNPTIPSTMLAECHHLQFGGFFVSLTFSGAVLAIYGDLTYNAGSIISSTTSKLVFAGTTLQSFSGLTDLSVHNLTIDNNAGLLLNNDISLFEQLSFGSGKIYTNNHYLSAGSVAGASASTFVVTGDNNGNAASTGGLRVTIPPSSSVEFPVGSNASSYTPILIKNTSGPSERFTVRVEPSAIAGPDPNATVNCTWQIDEDTPGGNTATIVLNWDQSQAGSSFDPNLCGIYKTDGSAIDLAGYMPQNGAASNMGGSSWQMALSGISSFSPWGITSDLTLGLPIHLISFNVRSAGSQIADLTWETGSGSDDYKFYVQKSQDGKQFFTFLEVDAHPSQKYKVQDDGVTDGTTYYRLEMEDLFGEFSYSDIKVLHQQTYEQLQARLIPNIINKEAVLELNRTQPGKINLAIFETSGRLVKTIPLELEKGMNHILIHLDELASGSYFGKLSDNYDNRTIRFVKY